MRILIVGNNPEEIGGVANYTRPLALKFKELGHVVYYLYSGAYYSKYNLKGKPYVRIKKEIFPFECAEIVNSTNLPFNFGYPELDVGSPEMDKVIAEYLERIKPDIVHINSRFGLPVSINEIAHKQEIAVVNTIHVYGYICQKRVMIDREGEPCPGPADLLKCAACTGALDYSNERRKALVMNIKQYLKHKYPLLFNVLRKSKANIISTTQDTGLNTEEKKTREIPPESLKILAERLTVRLRSCISALNDYSDCTICVSSDVKRTLARYGVKEEKMIVQHIGSTIAERQTVNNRLPHRPVILGNIGGVNYYKGTHVLIDAAVKVKNRNFAVKIFGRYDQRFIDAFREKIDSLPVELAGSYRPEDLPGILEQIDIMVLPSICSDTAPQTIFESFSGGIPIIASNIGGFPDFVLHDQNGLLFRAGDSNDLAENIEYILDHIYKIEEYKANIPRLKTIENNAEELIFLYDKLLRKRNARHDVN